MDPGILDGILMAAILPIVCGGNSEKSYMLIPSTFTAIGWWKLLVSSPTKPWIPWFLEVV